MIPTSRLRISPSRAARGFTLIEILVVVVIVGILVTFATLSMSNRALADKLETEAQRLQQLFAMAAEDAEMQGVEIGFVYTDQGYAFVTSAMTGRWVPITDGPLRPRKVQAPLSLDLRVEGRVVPPTPLADLLAAGKAAQAAAEREAAKTQDGPGKDDAEDAETQKKKDEEDTKALKPAAMFLSSGEATALTLDVAAPGVPVTYRVEIDNLGRGSLKTLENGR